LLLAPADFGNLRRGYYLQLHSGFVVGCWHGYLFGARYRFAYGPADVTASHYLLLQ